MGEHRNTGQENATTDRPTSFVVSPIADTNQFTCCSCDGVFLVTASIHYFVHDCPHVPTTHIAHVAQPNNHGRFTYYFSKKIIVAEEVPCCCRILFIALFKRALDPILNQSNPVHILTPCFFKIHFNIILIATSRSVILKRCAARGG
jgi:hypothetical protein